MGKPGRRERRSLLYGERTRGTETSQYPEEEESTEIPGVAASETGRRPNRPPCGGGGVGPAAGHGGEPRRGRGGGEAAGGSRGDRQPARLAGWGLWDLRTVKEKRREVPWEGAPETVRAR